MEPVSAVEDVKTIVKRVFFSADKPYDRASLHVDSLGVFLLLTLFQETGEQSYLKRLHELVHQSNVAQKDLRFAWFCKWNYALWKASQVTHDPSYEAIAITGIRKAHARFIQAAGTDRPRVWGALDANLENEVDWAEGNLDGEWGVISYEALNSTNEDKAVLKLEAEQMEKVVKATYMDFVSNDAGELGEALWLASCCTTTPFWVTPIRDKVFIILDSMWAQGYFEAPKKFRRAGPELWTAFGLACSKGVPGVWLERAAAIKSVWRADAVNGTLSVEDQLAYCLAVFPGTAWRGYRSDPTKELMSLSVRELRQALRSKGVDYSRCVEKQELIQLLLEKRGEK